MDIERVINTLVKKYSAPQYARSAKGGQDIEVISVNWKRMEFPRRVTTGFRVVFTLEMVMYMLSKCQGVLAVMNARVRYPLRALCRGIRWLGCAEFPRCQQPTIYSTDILRDG